MSNILELYTRIIKQQQKTLGEHPLIRKFN